MNRRELLLSPISYMPPPQLLDGLSPEDAARRIPRGSPSVVEIIGHLVFWESWFLNRCSGVAVPMVQHAADGWPTVTGADWEPLREQFVAGLQRALLLPEGPVDPPIEFSPIASYTIADAMIHL